jgi:4-alpha-glucanotransferase
MKVMYPSSRASGILLHITSLPSPFGIGDIGPSSFRFVDLLSQIDQRYWSILPLAPVKLEFHNSPYLSSSAFAGNTLLISPELLAKEGLLPKDYACGHLVPIGSVDYGMAFDFKNAIVEAAYQEFEKNRESKNFNHNDFEAFCSENHRWLDDYALFKVLRNSSEKPWYLWPLSLRDREPQAIFMKSQALRRQIDVEKFAQFIFFQQWRSLKNYCLRKNVCVIGDLPMYVSSDSADVWSHPALFKLDEDKKQKYIAGVPPDYFSRTGHMWGNPVYNWQDLEKTGFDWLTDRIHHWLNFLEMLRLDHFRGFLAFWQIPASAKTAEEGMWERVPPGFLKVLEKNFPEHPFIAEDLGFITNDVKLAIEQLRIPGMRVLLFGFDGNQDNIHLPSNYVENSVAYTGTHDTNTVKGWFVNEARAEEKYNIFKYINKIVSEKEISGEFVRLVLSSKAKLSIIPLQDILSIGAEGRLNHPSRTHSNWEWRVTPEQLDSPRLGELGEMTRIFERSNQ